MTTFVWGARPGGGGGGGQAALVAGPLTCSPLRITILSRLHCSILTAIMPLNSRKCSSSKKKVSPTKPRASAPQPSASSSRSLSPSSKAVGPPPYYPTSGLQAERDCISMVVPERLYLTNHRGAKDKATIESLSITHIVSVGEEFAGDEPLAESLGIKYHQCDVVDLEEEAERMRKVLRIAVDFIHSALSAPGQQHRVLVHCAGGISRSTTVVLAYLIIHQNCTLLKAFDQAYKARRVVWPNLGFMGLLIGVEQDHFSSTTTTPKPHLPTIRLQDYKQWLEFDFEAYQAAKVVDRDQLKP